jgi:glycosyltransferase involved in cell wall biosynthesis
VNAINKNKKKILVICPFPQGEAAGQRLKYEQYFELWNHAGYEVTVSCFMDQSLWQIVYSKGNYLKKIFGVLRGLFRRFLDLFRLYKFDIVYVFMWGTPFGSSLYERILRKLSKKVIYDIEDNVMMQQSNPLNPIMRLLRGPGKTTFLIKKSDHIITSSPFLNKYALGINLLNSATYISSSVNINRFIPCNSYSNKKIITLGWTGTFTSKEYLDLLAPTLLKLSQRLKFKLRIIGNFEYSLPGVDTEVIQWTKENEASDLQGIDIGLYPLPQNDWVLGKSGLKAIQYMAFGLPTVATNVGTTPEIIEHMQNGILVNNESEWDHYLEMLINDPSLRRSLGEKARETVKMKYSTDVIGSEYVAVLNSLHGERNG